MPVVSEPMDDQLRAHLDELDAKISEALADGHVDDAERSELRALIERVRQDLGTEEADHGLSELEESAVRFESDHPTIAAAIRSAVHTLTGYGI